MSWVCPTVNNYNLINYHYFWNEAFSNHHPLLLSIGQTYELEDSQAKPLGCLFISYPGCLWRHVSTVLLVYELKDPLVYDGLCGFRVVSAPYNRPMSWIAADLEPTLTFHWLGCKASWNEDVLNAQLILVSTVIFCSWYLSIPKYVVDKYGQYQIQPHCRSSVGNKRIWYCQRSNAAVHWQYIDMLE